MKLDDLVAHSRRDAERSRELERRAAGGAPPADEEDAFVRAVLDAGANDAIVRALAARSAPDANEPASRKSAPASIPSARRRSVFSAAALAAAPLVLAAVVALFFIGRGGTSEALPAYVVSAGGADVPVRGGAAANGGELSEGALVTVTAEPERAVRARVDARAYARCDGGAWSAARGRLTVAPTGAVRFQAARGDAFGAMRGACELAVVLALEGEPLVAPDAGATSVLTVRFVVR